MNLIIDIGNTRAKVAVYDDEAFVTGIVTDQALTGVDEFANHYECKRGIVSSTIDIGSESRERIEELQIPMLWMTGETPVPVDVHYATRKTLGTDRLAAVVGAWASHRGQDVLIIDAGTCVTYDFLNAEGRYWGGNISPGLHMRLRAMHQLTARLPEVEAEGDVPEVGYNTETAIRSGAIWGLRYEIEGYIHHFKEKYPRLLVFLTGGDAEKLDISVKLITFAPEFLVLRGLNQILNYNQ